MNEAFTDYHPTLEWKAEQVAWYVLELCSSHGA